MSVTTLDQAPPPPAPAAGEKSRPPRRRGRLTPYLLLLPGLLWLLVFFALPVIYQASTSVQTGSLEAGYEVTWRFATYAEALAEYWPQFLRSVVYAGTATVLCLVLGYPLAYLIAFRAGRWRNLIMILVIAPFFTSFLVRTLAWKTILADGGVVVDTLNTLHVLDVTAGLGLTDGERVLATPLAVVCGLTYNFLPFMILPPLRAPRHRLPPRHPAAVHAGRGGRNAADLHPGGRRLRQRRPAGLHRHPHDRQRHPGPVPAGPGLPDRRGALLHPDGRDPGGRQRPHPPLRDGGSRLMALLTWFRRHLVVIFGLLTLGYLLLPNVVVTVFSFNDPSGRFNYAWNEFSTAAWTDPCGVSGLCDSLALSLQLALWATLAATALGTMIAFALARYRFRGRGAVNSLIFLPMAMPEVVMAASLLTLFLNMGAQLGFWTVLIAHIMFCLSFVVTAVKARVMSMDPRLEQAAQDLYAGPVQTFLRVTLPIAWPGIAAGALLAFALSFDDFIITNFTAGSTVTFPMYVWGSAQRGTPVQINVVGTAMFLIAVLVVVVSMAVGKGRRRMKA
jgi:spermidine/putrescine transport system permease protein